MTIQGDPTPEQLRECAEMMAATDPWVTLRRPVEQCLSAISHEDAKALLATEDDKVVGFLIYNMRLGIFRGYIQTLCVAEGERGKGLGSKLMAEAEETIFRESPNVFICVSSFNSRAKSLYERLGYRLVGELEDLVVQGHSEFLLRKTTGPFADFRA
jgi:ribosomal protein S18 acetylase RimI-like enzyme